MTDSTEQQYVVASVLEFADGDGDDLSVNMIHVGDLDSCKLVSESIHAISYSGTRPVKSSRMVIRKWPPPEDVSAALCELERRGNQEPCLSG